MVNFARKGNLQQFGRSDGELEIIPRTSHDLRGAQEILSLRGLSIGTTSRFRQSPNGSPSIPRESRQPETTRSVD